MPGILRNPVWNLHAAFILAAALCAGGPLRAELSPDQAADLLLNSARKAYNDKNYPFAVTRFREFLGRFGGHKDAPAARYGLALALLESADKDYAAAAEQLQQAAGHPELPEHAQVLYYLGLSQRGLGTREESLAGAKPQEAAQHHQRARQRFEEASRHFAAALAAFSAKVADVPPDARELPVDLEWAARSRCDLADCQIRLQKPGEAQATAAPFLKDPLWKKSRYRALGLYDHGFASFLLHDYLTAGRSLNMLQPFSDPGFGTHARYLLARIHHLADERAEAAGLYQGVLSDYANQKKAAAEALKHPEKFKNDPGEKARLEAVLRDPPPDYVARTLLLLGVMLYEDGRFADALVHLTTLSQQFPKSPLLPEVQLRRGFCHVQLRQFPEAVKALQPLVDKEPRLADQALLWLAKAQAGAAPPNNPQAQQQALKASIDTLRRAADKAERLAGMDPEARTRRGEILLELADTQQLVGQSREAAGVYAQILAEKFLPGRAEEILQRQADALHLAGDYQGSDQLCERFRQTYPRSPLLAAVLFRHAENAYFQALAVEQNLSQPNRKEELARLNEEVLKRYQVIVDKFPESPNVNVARYALGMGWYRKGDLEKTQKILETIPQTGRAGDLAAVSYVLADCLLRQAPTKVEDALAAGKIQDDLEAAAKLLDEFLNVQPKGPQAPDALLKLGYCHQRLASLLAQPQERVKLLGTARAAYERLLREFPKHPLQGQAVLERAKCFAQAGDPGTAVRELQHFASDLKGSPVAPMGLLELATLLRGQNKAAEAVTVLARCRQEYEPSLLKDPARADWVSPLQYQHGLALREAGKLSEARAVFEQAAGQFADRAEGAEAALRGGQCLQEEGLQKVQAARKALAASNHKPDAVTAAARAEEEGLKMVRTAIARLEEQIGRLKEKQPTWEVRARMLYETAWCYRTLAEAEVAAARSKIQQEMIQQDKTDKKGPAPEVPSSKIPLQPSEKKARAQYQTLIDEFPDLPLAADARFELAEMLSERGEDQEAQKLLNDALDKEPPAGLSDKIRLRLGEYQAARGETGAALAQFESLAQDPKNPLAGQAHYRAGECLLRLKAWDKAVAHLTVFRDQQPFQNLPDLTDRALLRLGQALAQLGQWDKSRQAHEQVVARFGNSPWIHEARYGMGWAWQQQRQFDQAVHVYNQVVAGTAMEVAARAQLQIGLCRLEQKRYPEAANALQAVFTTYDYPELTAAALSEVGRTFTELKQYDQAAKFLRRVIEEHPTSPWVQVAKDRLAALPRN